MPLVRVAPTCDPVAILRSPATIRARCERIFAAAESDSLPHFELNMVRLETAAGYVTDMISHRYPTLDIPFHSRWRHFTIGDLDLWGDLQANLRHLDPDELARVRIDLAVVSVLLDAGAGPDWRYRDAYTGTTLARSEGLAIASFRMFASGLFSRSSATPLRVDAGKLATLTAEDLAAGFQITDDNPLIGLQGRAEILRNLGMVMSAMPAVFGAERPRIGNMLDRLRTVADTDSTLSAVRIFDLLLTVLTSVWPQRIVIDGRNLGDVGRHQRLVCADATNGLIPFHKLTQWLTYSLVEPLQSAGFKVAGLDELTGLPEYRNGGLFIDLGVLVPRRRDVLTQTHAADSELVVEWRALTVALLDRIAQAVRRQFGLTSDALPMIKVLEGGTWHAGRRIANELREGGAPPIRLVSDGTLF